ncbi:MAG TPA: hypothetical protein VJC08_04650, partial [bacterium]|nr:hypothetical protein [bacterium]
MKELTAGLSVPVQGKPKLQRLIESLLIKSRRRVGMIFLRQFPEGDNLILEVSGAGLERSANNLSYLLMYGFMFSTMRKTGQVEHYQLEIEKPEPGDSGEEKRISLHGGSYSSVTRIVHSDGSTLIEKTADPRQDGGKLLAEGRYMQSLQAEGIQWFPKVYEVKEDPQNTLVRMEDLPLKDLSRVIEISFMPGTLHTHLGYFVSVDPEASPEDVIRYPIPLQRTPFDLSLEIYKKLIPDFYAHRQSETPEDYLDKFIFNKLENDRWAAAAKDSPVVKGMLAAPFVKINHIGSEENGGGVKFSPNLPLMLKMFKLLGQKYPEYFLPPYLSRQHGDLHFGNILVDPFDFFTKNDLSSMRLVDPKYIPEGNDPLYDFAKLIHNLYGRYDLATGHASTYHFDIDPPSAEGQPLVMREYLDDEAIGTIVALGSVDAFTSQFTQFLTNPESRPFPFEKNDETWRVRLLFLHAALIAGLFPYHINKEDGLWKVSVLYESALEKFSNLLNLLYESDFMKPFPEIQDAWQKMKAAEKSGSAYASAIHELSQSLDRLLPPRSEARLERELRAFLKKLPESQQSQFAQIATDGEDSEKKIAEWENLAKHLGYKGWPSIGNEAEAIEASGLILHLLEETPEGFLAGALSMNWPEFLTGIRNFTGLLPEEVAARTGISVRRYAWWEKEGHRVQKKDLSKLENLARLYAEYQFPYEKIFGLLKGKGQLSKSKRPDIEVLKNIFRNHAGNTTEVARELGVG